MTESSFFEHPERIGPYHILQVIGEGGMGVVYDAQQKEPVRRRVAIKMIKVGMDSKEVMRRFESEHQALAVMDHPGIAKVFDGGLTEAGRPYFAMELVKGVPITEYCDSQRLTTGERLALMIETCAAVQHAHQKGVIHRDLKPSNILVGIQDGRPVPKIIDFGIAKAIGGGGRGEPTALTRLGQMVGTPQYMSPEQAEMSGLDVDTRADIYSLGMVLYELITGALPLSLVEPVAEAVPFVMRHSDAPRPSLRYSSMGYSMQSVAHSRRTDPGTLRKELRGDLDWIVMRAIHADRTRRYETANGLAMELRRYLAHEPVHARPPSAAYQVGKFVQRNRGAVGSAVVVLLLIVSFFASTVLQARQIALERDRTASEAETAQRVTEFLVGLFAVSEPSQARGETVTAREVLDLGAERIRGELADEPEVRGRLMEAMGRVYMGLGLYDDAEALLMEGLDARTSALGPADSTVANSLQGIGWLYSRQGRNDEALPVAREAVRTGEAVYGADDLRSAGPLQLLGIIQRDRGEFEEGREALERSLEIRRAQLEPDHPDIGWTLYHLGWLAQREGNLEEAERHYDEATTILEAALDPMDPQLGWLYNDIAVLQSTLGHHEAARDMHEKVLALREATQGPIHPDVAATLQGLAWTLSDLGDSEAALAHQRRALSIRREVFGPESYPVATTLNNLGLLLQQLERFAEARDVYTAGLQILDSVLEPSDSRLVGQLNNLGYLYRHVGEPELARPLLERALRIGEESFGPAHHDLTGTLTNLSYLYQDLRRYDDAVSYAQRAYDIEVARLGADQPLTAAPGSLLGFMLTLAGDAERAVPLLERAIDLGASQEDPNPWLLAGMHWELGYAKFEMREEEAADSQFRRASELSLESEASDRLVLHAYLELRTACVVGDREAATTWLTELLDHGYTDPSFLRDPILDPVRDHPLYSTLTTTILEAVRLND